MTGGQSEVARQLQTLFRLGAAGGLTDGELLERFATRRDAAAEAAFAALMERHGPLVLRVCRDVLRDRDDAEDAFQATFLVLARRAGSIRDRDALASWLYGVALRVAARARSANARRRAHERKAATATCLVVEGAGARSGDDLGRLLHEEVGRLPEKYRAAVLLCYWEGLTHEQAAERLHWPVGTVRSRLSWARQRLRARLNRRGLAPSAAPPIATPSAPAGPLPAALVEGTIRGALRLAAGRAPAGLVSSSAWELTKGAFRTMMLTRWKLNALVGLMLGIATAGAGGLASRESDEPRPPATTKGEPSRATPPDREPEIASQLDRLKEYKRELEARIEQKEAEWLELAKNANIALLEPAAGGPALPRATPNRVSVEEYKHVRSQLFQTWMDLIQAEAMLAQLEGEFAAVFEAFLRDPEVVAVVDQIEKAAAGLIAKRDRPVDRPELDLAQDLRSLSDRYQRLWALKGPMLRKGLDPIGREAEIRAVKARIEASRTRKSLLERLLAQVEVAHRKQATDAVRVILVTEDLAGLRSMLDSVSKRIEQLQFDARETRKR